MRPLIDIHAHLQFADYNNDQAEALTRAHEAGVDVINVGTGAVTSQKAVLLAETNDCYAAVGLHPVYVNELRADDPDMVGEPESLGERFKIIEELANHHKVVSIGECGLDYFHVTDPAAQALQKEWFINQIELAKRTSKPLILHVRNGKNKADTDGAAYQDVLTILKQYPGVKGDVHFFAGTIEEARAFLDIGFYLSFTGVITFAPEYKELVSLVPLNRIMTETDCPYVAPAPFRGKRNEPAYVVEIAKKIAEIKGLSEDEVFAQLRQNALDLFGV